MGDSGEPANPLRGCPTRLEAPAAVKVSELVEHLSHLDPDMPVLINGYEGGYHELESGFIRIAWTFPNRYHDDNEWYYGPHWESETEAEGAAESVVFDRPRWTGRRHSPAKTTSGWDGRPQHA